MVYRVGRYGKFLACPNFPDCRNTKPVLNYIDAKCPKCGSYMILKRSRKGETCYLCANEACRHRVEVKQEDTEE